MRFELGKVDASLPLSEYITTKAAQEAQEKEDDAVEAAIIGERIQTAKEPEEEAQEEFKEAHKPRQHRERAISAEDGFAAFKGLQGTISYASDTPQANMITTTSPRTPKPFTPNPTPSTTSATELPYISPPPSAQPSLKESRREFHLTITRSVMNHHAYIQRQHYYGPFHLDWRSLMAEDLKGRVPTDGFRDLGLGKAEAPLRVRLRRREEEEEEENGGGRVGLRELWEGGQRKRQERREVDV